MGPRSVNVGVSRAREGTVFDEPAGLAGHSNECEVISLSVDGQPENSVGIGEQVGFDGVAEFFEISKNSATPSNPTCSPMPTLFSG